MSASRGASRLVVFLLVLLLIAWAFRVGLVESLGEALAGSRWPPA